MIPYRKILTEGILGTIKSWIERNKIKYDFRYDQSGFGFVFKNRLSADQARELNELLESKKYTSDWSLNSKSINDKLRAPFDSVIIPVYKI